MVLSQFLYVGIILIINTSNTACESYYENYDQSSADSDYYSDSDYVTQEDYLPEPFNPSSITTQLVDDSTFTPRSYGESCHNHDDCNYNLACISEQCLCPNYEGLLYDEDLKRCVSMVDWRCSLNDNVRICTKNSECHRILEDDICKCSPDYYKTPSNTCELIVHETPIQTTLITNPKIITTEASSTADNTQYPDDDNSFSETQEEIFSDKPENLSVPTEINVDLPKIPTILELQQESNNDKQSNNDSVQDYSTNTEHEDEKELLPHTENEQPEYNTNEKNENFPTSTEKNLQLSTTSKYHEDSDDKIINSFVIKSEDMENEQENLQTFLSTTTNPINFESKNPGISYPDISYDELFPKLPVGFACDPDSVENICGNNSACILNENIALHVCQCVPEFHLSPSNDAVNCVPDILNIPEMPIIDTNNIDNMLPTSTPQPLEFQTSLIGLKVGEMCDYNILSNPEMEKQCIRNAKCTPVRTLFREFGVCQCGDGYFKTAKQLCRDYPTSKAAQINHNHYIMQKILLISFITYYL